MGIVFAFCSLICSALNDFLFKLFANNKGNKGFFMAIVGAVWCLALLCTPFQFKNHVFQTILWGSVSGIFSFTSNVLLIQSMSYQSATICSTVYRLNLVSVVLGAAILLGESLTLPQYAGVTLAVAAVGSFLLDKGSVREEDRKKALLGTLLVIGASLIRAGMGLSYKYGFNQGADPGGVALINSFFWVGGGLIYALVTGGFKEGVSKRLSLLSSVSGLLVAGIVFFMAQSLALAKASIVLPIAQMSFLGTLTLSAIFLKERLTFPKILGILCGIAAILLLSL